MNYLTSEFSAFGKPEVNSILRRSFSANTNIASTLGRLSASTLAFSGPIAINTVAKASDWVAEGANTDTETIE